jgi:endo-1,4-beta-xylanase
MATLNSHLIFEDYFMQNQNTLFHSLFQRHTYRLEPLSIIGYGSPRFRKQLKILLIFVFMIGLLPLQSLSQPLASGKSKFLGCSVSSIRTNFSKYWNQVTPENAGKWGSAEGGMDSYNWSPLDAIYNYAMTNGFPYKHHALIWGSQYPSWITSLDSASQRAQIEEWIYLVGTRYPDMNFIDVVNEPFTTQVPFKKALGGDGATGWDWVITAFQWARQYCSPGVKLILNEYNILQSNDVTNRYIALIDTLSVRGLIDAIGIQGHYFEFKGSGYMWSIPTIKSNLDRLAAKGLPIYITEFDINEPVDSVQLASYKTYFPIFWEHPAVKGITLWGYVENDTWLANANLLDSRNAERPALKWLRSYIVSPFAPVLITPVSVTGAPRNPIFVWRTSDSATSYHVQVSTNSTFASSIVLDTTVIDTALQVSPLTENTRFYWRVSAANDLGTSEYSITANFKTGSQIVAVREPEGSPTQFYLSQNYPNPFNPVTQIQYSLPEKGFVSLRVYNIFGAEVATLCAGVQQAGSHSVMFNGKGFASGIYLYRLQSGNFMEAKKLILLK